MSNVRSIGDIAKGIVPKGVVQASSPQEKKKDQPEQAYIHPIFTNENFKDTIANYNLHIKKYNMKVWMENAEVREFNKEVISFRREKKPSAEQRVQEIIFKEQHENLPPKDYNKKVESYNEKNGPQLRKRKISQEVKPDSEKYFIAFLHQYNMQLFKRKRLRLKLDVSVPGSLPKLDLYPNKIIEAERNGCKNLPVSKETIRHHRERLEQAGVLHGYEYKGSTRPLKIAFNEDILSLTDNKTPKNRTAENQAVTPIETNKVQYNNVSSRKDINKIKIRDKGVVASAPTHLNCTEESTETPKRQAAKKNDAAQKKLGAPAEENPISVNLYGFLQEKKELAQKLALGEYDKYRNLAINSIRKEAFYGSMHPDDFIELAIQDVFKFSASIFKKLENIHPGSWVNAYKIWLQNKFRTFNNQSLNKPNTLKRWEKCIKVLKEVKTYQKNHPEWYPHYPSLFFDTERVYKENNSFEYAYRNFRLEEPESSSDDKNRKHKALKSMRAKTDVKKAQEKVKDFIINKISIDELYDYVNYNCNPSVLENLNEIIKKEFKKIESTQNQ